MTALAPALTSALVEFIWQGTLIAAALWLALALLASRSAFARYLAAAAAMAVLALAPVVTFWRMYAGPPAAGLVFPEAVSRITAIAGSSIGKGTSGWLARNWVLEVWAVGVLLFSLRLVWSGAQVHRLRRAGQPAAFAIVSTTAALSESLGLTRAVQVLFSNLADVPSVVGWLRPVILLPGSVLTGLTAEQLETVLAHELAHVRRHDYAVNLLQVVMETLLFYHPAVWWVSGRMRQERELCCDDMVVESCDRLVYARALTTLERLRGTAPALALGSNGGGLSFRVKRLVSNTPEQRTAPRFAAVTVLTLALVCFALSLNWTRVQAQDNLTVPSADSNIDVDTNGAALIHRAPVQYPASLKEKKIGGTVTVEATLDERGVVADARVVNGLPELRKPALASVLNWHFMPGGAGAIRVVTITFRPPAHTLSPAEKTAIMARQQDVLRLLVPDEIESGQRPPAGAAKALRLQLPDEQTALTQRLEAAAAPQTTMTIFRIEAGGLSNEVTKELLARLPIHAGDLLSPERLGATREAVRQFDEHFLVGLLPIADNGVIVRIDIPLFQ